MNFKKLLLIFCIPFSCVLAQVKPVYTQYMLNQYLLNPAVAGTQDYWDLKASSRFQWVGVEGYPKSIYASAQGSFGKTVLNTTKKNSKKTYKTKNYNGDPSFHGLGGIIAADKTGPTSVISAYASYTFNLKLSRDLRIALGIAPGFQNFSINSDGFEISTARDISVFVPDLTAGLWLYNTNFYFGFSSHQILESKLNLYNLYYNKNKLNRHYFANAGYKVELGNFFYLVPSVMVRYINPLPADVDLNLKGFYDGRAWAGFTFRPVSKSVAFMAGMNFNGKIDFSYAYDYYNSYLNTVSFGTHEIIVGYRFRINKELYSPSDFW